MTAFDHRRVVEEIGVLLLFIAATVIMTWPLARDIATAVPDHGDAYVSTLVMRWDAHAILTDAPLFDLPIFHPSRRALAFSEHLIGITLPALPFYSSASPLALYNVLLLFGFAFSGYGAWVLCRTATGSRAGALAGGLFFAFLPYRFNHIAHISYVTAGWLALLFAAWLWWCDSPTPRRAVLFSAAFLLNGLVCLHWFVLGSVALAFAAPVAVVGAPRLRTIRPWLPIAGATAVAVAALFPLLRPYLEVRELYGMERRIEDTLPYSALPSDWLVTPLHIAYGPYTNNSSTDAERWLFPGVVPILLVLALFLGARRRDGDPPPAAPRRIAVATLTIATAVAVSLTLLRAAARFPLRWDFIPFSIDLSGSPLLPGVVASIALALLIVITRPLVRPTRPAMVPVATAVVWIVTAAILAAGPATPFYRLLFTIFSPLRGMRVPARWSMIVFAALAILIAFAVKKLAAGTSPPVRVTLLAVCCAALLFEQRGIRRYLHAPTPSAATRWLMTNEVPGAIVEIPFRKGRSEYHAMLAAAFHLRPMLNGVSSFEPPDRNDLESALEPGNVEQRLLPTLRRMNASLLIVHPERLEGAREPLEAWLIRNTAERRIVHLRRFCSEYVFALRSGPGMPFDGFRPLTDCDQQDGTVVEPRVGVDTRGALHVIVKASAATTAVFAHIDNGELSVPLQRVDPHTWTARVGRRPDDVPRETDLQIELAGPATAVRLPGQPLIWRRQSELRWYDWQNAATWRVADRLGQRELGRAIFDARRPEKVIVREVLRAAGSRRGAELHQFASQLLLGKQVRRDGIRDEPAEQIVLRVIETPEFERDFLRPPE